jgi:hypothetical protein
MIVRAFALAVAAVIAAGSAAFALDHSTRGPRSPIELCCIDVALLPPIETSVASDRHPLPHLNQVAPTAEVKTGLDGADWNCRRPDGSRRCFTSLRDQ